VSRALPPGLRHAAVAALVARRARHADVVYGTSMIGRTALGAMLARRPFVAKLTSDPAFERAHRRGLVSGPRLALLRLIRDWSVRRAAHVIGPSAYIAELAAKWRGGSEGVSVLPNPAPHPAEAAAVESPAAPPLLVFAGRLTAAKNLGMAFAALPRVPAATLVVVGDGEERARLEAAAGNAKVLFLGARPRAEVLGLLGAADLAVLPSAWENFPHAAVEALAMGTPVVATRVGGVPEIVRDGENGLLVEAGDIDAFGDALARLLADDAFRGRLAAAAAPSVERFATGEVYGALERILEEAAR
jgi:glycosyltransferase involved in cell wall biosynthesis